MGRGPHSCLEAVWKLSEKCLVLDRRFGRRMGLSGMCQEVVWTVSGVTDEKSKPTAGRPLAGLLHRVVQGNARRGGGGRFGFGRATTDKGSGVTRGPTQLSRSCLEVAWKVSGVRPQI